jgi:hypothetical protein
MAGIVLGAQSSLPSYFKQGGEAKLNPTITSFEKDLAQVLSSLKKAEKTWQSWEFYQKVYVMLAASMYIIAMTDIVAVLYASRRL